MGTMGVPGSFLQFDALLGGAEDPNEKDCVEFRDPLCSQGLNSREVDFWIVILGD